MDKVKVGVVGCGSIGAQLCKYIDMQLPHMQLVAICDTKPDKTKELMDSLIKRPKILDLDRLIDESILVIEAASKEACREVVIKCCQKMKDAMIMSSGAMLENPNLLESARKHGIRLYVPSGAILGLDGLKAAMMGQIESVTLTTRKPPKGLEGAPYISQKGIKLNEIKEEMLIFEGTALDAVAGFPANINVAATLSLAGIGAKRTRVRIFASPQVSSNIHEVEIKGEHGRLVTRAENFPSPNNPKTSYLAILSAMAMLKQISETIRIGT